MSPEPYLEAEIRPLRQNYTAGCAGDVSLEIRLPVRSEWVDCRIRVPKGIRVRPDDVLVNVIGRGWQPIRTLALQSPGRCARGYARPVGSGSVEPGPEDTLDLCLRELDIRADNGVDVAILLKNARFATPGSCAVSLYGEMDHGGVREALRGQTLLRAVSTVADFSREMPKPRYYAPMDLTAASFRWTPAEGAEEVRLLHSPDQGRTWEIYTLLSPDSASAQVSGLESGMEHWFRLDVAGGRNTGLSNVAKVFAGMYNVRTLGGAPTDGRDAAEGINGALAYLESLGGGVALFEGGIFSTTTIFLKSNVWLYLDKSAQIHALPGCQDEEVCWFSDGEFRTDQSHMSGAPYLTPENWMTKQDAGHSYFHNALFFGERLDNVKIIGNGRISGEGNLTKSNTVMEQPSGQRTDKLFALKLCTNVEIGGLNAGKDLWYEETDRPNADQPFYLDENGENDGLGIDNMLRIANAGHFVVLATGVDGISTHDIYGEKGPLVRDIFDYMGCCEIAAFNIYAQGAPDDVIKLGSDCSLGFTRPSKNCLVRNIIGDTACNLFQIGSETADDIRDVCVDNLYVLGSDKAGFSISVNDGGQIRNIHLNCGGTGGRCCHGVDHGMLALGYTPGTFHPHPSVMRRVRTPFFISLSNRGRTIGCEAVETRFVDDTGVERQELMVTNVDIGRIENVSLRNVDVGEVYAASQAKSPGDTRWPAFSGQARTTAMVVGYRIPRDAGMTMPDGSRQRDIENVLLEDIHITVKGGNPPQDGENTPRELGVGQFNLRNLAEDARGSKIPAYGWYIRHVNGLTMRRCSLDWEEPDGRYGVVLEDVKNSTVEDLTAPEGRRENLTIRKGVE